MFKSILISVAIAPMLLGVIAARSGGRDRVALRVGWVAYAVLWFAALFYLRYR